MTVWFDSREQHSSSHIVPALEWLSSATVINICISIVLAWLNTNSRISGLAQQFPFCFTTNIHTYWCFSSWDTRLKHGPLLSFCLLENITSIPPASISYLSFVFVLSFHLVPFISKSFHHLVFLFSFFFFKLQNQFLVTRAARLEGWHWPSVGPSATSAQTC